MDLQVAIFEIQGEPKAFALNRARECRGDVEVQRVAEFVLLGGAAGFDAGGHVAGIVASEAGFAERAEQIAEGFESQEVQALVGDFEFGLLRFADLPADA